VPCACPIAVGFIVGECDGVVGETSGRRYYAIIIRWRRASFVADPADLGPATSRRLSEVHRRDTHVVTKAALDLKPTSPCASEVATYGMSGTLAQVSHSVAEMPPALMMTAHFSISLRTNFCRYSGDRCSGGTTVIPTSLILDGGRVHGGDGRTMKFLDDQWWCTVRQEKCQPGICVEVG
jgi:hypothetical protein